MMTKKESRKKTKPLQRAVTIAVISDRSHEPKPSLTALKPSLTAPKPSLTALKPSLTAPKPSLTAPKPSLAAPKPSLAAPKPSLTAPTPSLAAPKRPSGGNAIRVLFPKTSRSNQDELLLSEYLTSTTVEQPVKLRIDDRELGHKPITIASVLRLNVEKYPERHAYGYRLEDTWKFITYVDLFNLVKRAAKGFISFGLQRFFGVAIFGRNTAEWAIANIAAIYAGGIVVPLALAVSVDECFNILTITRCSIVVVGSSKQLETVAQIRHQLTNIKAIIMYGKDEAPKSIRFHTWDQLLAMGDRVDDERLQERIAFQAPNLCCTILHTTGTTGPPKPVMISQDNLIWTSRTMGRRLSCSVASAVNMAILSYAHATGLIFNLYMPLLFASTVYFISTPAVFEWVKEVKPTMLYAPYLAFDELRRKLTSYLTRSRLSGIIYWWAKSVGLRGYMAMTNRRALPICWPVANSLVYEEIRMTLGLLRCREVFIGGRVVSRDVLEFFTGLNIPVQEIYGMTETSGPSTISAMPDMSRLTSAGRSLDGCFTKIIEPDENGVGEICVRGRNVFMGYLNDQESTSEAVDKDGWFKTGDLARADKDGFIYIIGKTADSVILENGETIFASQLEALVREALPVIRNCMVVGKGRSYVGILLAIKTEVDWRTFEVLSTLTPDSKEWFNKLGYKEESIDKFLKSPDKRITNKIQATFDRLNATLKPPQRIHKWTIIPQSFSVHGGELTWIQNTRRFVVEEKYAGTIDSMFIEK